MASKDRIKFDEACKELGISEEELEQLVANGEIACTKEGDTLFFKADAIGNFKKNRKTEPTIILTEEEMGVLDGLEEIEPSPKAAKKPAGKAAPKPAEKKEPEPVVPELEGMDEIVIETRGAEKAEGEPTPAAASPDDTVLNLDGLLEDDGSEGTTPIPGSEVTAGKVDETTDITVEGNVSDETLLDTDLLEVAEEEDSFKLEGGAAGDEALTEPLETNLLRGGGARAMAMKRKKSHGGFTVMLILTAVIFLAPLGVALNTMFLASPDAKLPTPDGKKEGVKSAPKTNPWDWIQQANVAGGAVNGVADLFTGG